MAPNRTLAYAAFGLVCHRGCCRRGRVARVIIIYAARVGVCVSVCLHCLPGGVFVCCDPQGARTPSAKHVVRNSDMLTWLRTYNPKLYRRFQDRAVSEKQLREWFDQLDTGTGWGAVE